MISTKNRWQDLEKALLSLRKQDLKHKVIVMDDNSDDGTSENVARLFPEVTLYSHQESRGYIVRRNEAVRLATTPYVLSIDDDCTLEHPGIISEMAEFCRETRCAAVAWPYIDVKVSNCVQSVSPSEGLWQGCTFKGCAFIVDRIIFLRLNGFRESFCHQGEEEDFCIRLLQFGFPVLLGKGHAIHHHESTKRSWERMDFYGSRNLILFAVFNVPVIFLPFQIAASAINCILYGFKLKRPYQKTRGVIYGILDGIRLSQVERKPVSVKSFVRYRKLKSKYHKIG
ncbi:GT2 family glycosyltransferase [Pontibacter ummariensis]|nr:glycosyltransferase [Pontibacter ummariensis]PRY06761.1 GT2 family glycosyltransferase [Pontibacter ummariensis]